MRIISLTLLLMACAITAVAQDRFEKDAIKTASGSLEITFIGHGSLMLKYDGKVIYVDPYSKLADYATLLKADAILVTHEHKDHLDPAALQGIRTKDTTLVLTAMAAESVPGGIIMKNGDVRKVRGVLVEAVPAYNHDA